MLTTTFEKITRHPEALSFEVLEDGSTIQQFAAAPQVEDDVNELADFKL